MAYDFNADEVFEIAKEIEVNGTKFYREAAEGVSDAAAKEFLLKLADMEVEHEETFADLQKELTASDKAQTVFDPQDEAALYLKSLADTRVFFEKEIDTSSMEAILKAAITAEKDSIVFYLGMKDLVAAKYGSDKIDDIIKEEMSHIKLLSTELAKLKK